MKEFIYKIFESLFIHYLKKNVDVYLENKKTEEKINKPVILKTEQSDVKKELTETTKRLKTVIELLFQNEFNLKYPLSRVADSLGLKSENEFIQLLNGETELTFEFLNSFSKKYGIDRNWLKYGENTPFFVEENQLYATGYIKIIKDVNPKNIFLVRENSKTGRTGIVLKLNTWNYKILGKSYHISSEVGGTGQIQIKGFYNFIKELNSLGFKYKIRSKIISQRLYSKLFSGYISPRILESNNHNEIKNSYWADDFLDFNHDYPIAEDYERWYGCEFVKAQNILKYQLQA